jgi:hypothetical protein
MILCGHFFLLRVRVPAIIMELVSVLDKTFGLNQAQCQIHQPNATFIGLYIQPSQTSQGMHYLNLYLYLKLILTWALERYLQVPPLFLAPLVISMLGFRPPARSISSTNPPM